MQNIKENLINELTLKISLTDLSISSIKQTLELILYNYDVNPVESTAISSGNAQTTKELMNYFRIGKLGSNKSLQTLEQYEITVRQLCDFTHRELNMITSDDIKYFLIGYKLQNKVSDVTMNNKRRNLSSIFSYLYNNKKIFENPMNSIEAVKCQVKVKKILDDSEVERIIMAIDNDRDMAIIYFLLSTGVRVSELCNLMLKDVDFQERSAIVLGKGNKQREVYFDKKTAIRLEKYLSQRNDIRIKDGSLQYDVSAPLFASRIGKIKPLAVTTIEYIIKKAGQESGINRAHPHLFRATYATKLAENGTPLNVIAKVLGHANLNTIQKYVLMSDQEIKKILKE